MLVHRIYGVDIDHVRAEERAEAVEQHIAEVVAGVATLGEVEDLHFASVVSGSTAIGAGGVIAGFWITPIPYRPGTSKWLQPSGRVEHSIAESSLTASP